MAQISDLSKAGQERKKLLEKTLHIKMKTGYREIEKDMTVEALVQGYIAAHQDLHNLSEFLEEMLAAMYEANKGHIFFQSKGPAFAKYAEQAADRWRMKNKFSDIGAVIDRLGESIARMNKETPSLRESVGAGSNRISSGLRINHNIKVENEKPA